MFSKTVYTNVRIVPPANQNKCIQSHVAGEPEALTDSRNASKYLTSSRNRLCKFQVIRCKFRVNNSTWPSHKQLRSKLAPRVGTRVRIPAQVIIPDIQHVDLQIALRQFAHLWIRRQGASHFTHSEVAHTACAGSPIPCGAEEMVVSVTKESVRFLVNGEVASIGPSEPAATAVTVGS